MNLVTLLEFVLFFGVILFLHEFGHYILAKLFRINVEEFGFGFPPRLAKIGRLKETDITLNWIPFGAFVRMSGENDPAVPGGFGSANPFKRLAVLLGGPIMNLLTGVILFAVLFGQVGIPDISKVVINLVSDNSPAQMAGLQTGDQITEINKITIENSDSLITLVQQNLGKEIEIGVLRDNQPLLVRAVPRVDPPAGQGALGIEMTNPITKASWSQTVPLAFRATYEQIKLTFQMPGKLIRGEVSGEDARVVGPVGMYSMFSQARQQDETSTPSSPTSGGNGLMTLQLIIAISIALGITNLLPIPALDGGRIFFMLPELFFKKPIPAKYENLANTIGFVALLALMFFVTAQDIINPIKLP